MTFYSCNDNFFAHDTPESFYWAGFIAADGCVMKKIITVTRLEIHLAKKDYNHLEKFRAAVEFDGRVKISKKACRLTIHSGKICSDLVRFNIVPRKTKIYTFPEWLVNHLLVNHFMRGYFDGDGSVFTRRSAGRKMDTLCFKVCGTDNFVRTYKRVLLKNIPELTLPGNISEYRNISILKCTGNRKSTKIRDFLYSSTNNLKLDRKYDIFYRDIFVNMPYSFRAKKVIGTNTKTGEKVVFRSMSESEKYGFKSGSISRCCSGIRKSHKGYIWATI